jgi:uncharacterized protein (AIM24 family)
MNEVYLPSSSSAESAELTLGSPTLGAISRIDLKRGDVWLVRDSSFVAASPSVRIDHKFNLSGDENRDRMFQDQVVPLTRVSVRRGEDRGVVFIGAFGATKQREVKEGDLLCVNGGLFLAANGADAHYTVQAAGSIFTSVASCGSSHLLKFQGPCTILTQSHSAEAFSAAMENLMYHDPGRSDDESEDDSEDDEDDEDDSEDESDEDEDEEDEDEDEDEDEEEEDEESEDESDDEDDVVIRSR